MRCHGHLGGGEIVFEAVTQGAGATATLDRPLSLYAERIVVRQDVNLEAEATALGTEENDCPQYGRA